MHSPFYLWEGEEKRRRTGGCECMWWKGTHIIINGVVINLPQLVHVEVKLDLA